MRDAGEIFGGASGADATPAPDPWYAMEHLPAGRLRVRVMWSGREFLAGRVLHPETRRLVWCAMPRPGIAVVWFDNRGIAAAGLDVSGPDAWQPEDAAKWVWPNGVQPEPLTGSGGRMWSSRMRFAAVDDAEAADLAREMERGREEASADAGGHPKRNQEEGAGERQPWLDPHAVTYSQPGSVTPREAEARIMRAFLTESWIRIEKPSTKTFGSILAGMIKPDPLAPGDLAAMDLPPERWEPTGRDQDDMLVALGWLVALDEMETAEAVLRARARVPARSWRKIGEMTGQSHAQARLVHLAAIEKITRLANGEHSMGQHRAERRLNELRERNRKARQR